MKARLRGAYGRIRPLLPRAMRQAIGRLSQRRPEFSQPLAFDGGPATRDLALHPWATAAEEYAADWRHNVEPRFRDIYLSGIEGLPQPLARRAAAEWARYCATTHAVMVGHGTDALRIGLAAMLEHDGLDYGGEIIVPNLSFIASATAALDRRFGVVLVDVDPRTHLIDPAQVEAAIVPGRTRAIMAVHLYGQPADMTALTAIAGRHGLKIIEDAAQAHGAAWAGRRVGGLGDVGAFSFQSSKCLSTGEGGMLVTNDSALFERAWAMQNVGRTLDGPGRWEHVTLGWNCRPTEYQAALLLHRLAGFERQQSVRARNFAALRARLTDSRAVEPLAVQADVSAHAMYMFVMRYRAEHCGGLDTDTFLKYVRAEGAPVVRGFAKTISEQPAIARLQEKHPDYVRVLSTPVADRAVRDTVYVPHDVFLGTEADMDDLATAILRVERHFSKG